MTDWFARAATAAGRAAGSPWAFIVAVAIVLCWLLSGPLFSYSDTWQLVINTSTTIVTFLMVFLIQNAQNRNDAAVHLKMDEMLRALPEARTSLAVEHLEEASEEAIRAEQERFHRLAEREQL